MEFIELREIVSKNLLKEAKVTRIDGVDIYGRLLGFHGEVEIKNAEPLVDHLYLYTSAGDSYLPTKEVRNIEIL